MDSFGAQAAESDLAYLGFFPVAFGRACFYLSVMYDAAKDQAGPLKPGVEDVEHAFRTVLGPMLKLMESSFNEILCFVDKKVEEKLKVLKDTLPAFLRPTVASLFNI